MFTCPACRKSLVRRQSSLGVYWSCEQCGGRAVGIGLLRKTINEKIVAQAWSQALALRAPNGRPCPVCARSMKEVTVDVAGNPMALDVCQRCEFMWFDATEYEAMPAATPKPRALGDIDETQLPQQAREALAMERVDALRASQSDEPDSEWKLIPAALGFPVEMDEAPFTRTPWATWLLAALIVGVSVAAFPHLKYAVDTYGMIPAQAWRYDGLTFITSFFLHGGILHLVGNVYFLLIFGCHVEDFLGRWRWLLLVILAAFVGDFADILIDPRQDLPSIGASGGISGLIAFYALKFPHAQLGFLFRYAYVYFRWIRFPAWFAFLIWIAFQLLGAYRQIEGTGNVASLAHLGGSAVGVAFWAIWRHLDQKPVRGAIPVQIS
jgi:membrane associated rhomboid family serine protease/Zn-finger nucleic acid-binding protein